MCIFTTSVPNETAFRIWDYMFYLGPKVLFEMALAILKLNEQMLRKIKDVTETALFLNQQATKIFNCTQLFEVGLKSLDGNKILTMREQFKQQIDSETKEKQKMQRLQQLSENTRFSRSDLDTMYSHLTSSLGTSATLIPGQFSVDFNTFTQIIRNVFPEWGKEDNQFLEELFLHGFGTNGGLIQFTSLVKGLSCLCKGTLEEKLNFCFKVFATNECDFIDKERLNWMLCSIYRMFGQTDFLEEVAFFVDMIFEKVKSEGVDTKLGFVQFQELCLTQPLIRKCFQLDNPKQERILDLTTLSKGLNLNETM